MQRLLPLILLISSLSIATPAWPETERDGFFAFKYSQIDWDQHSFILGGQQIDFTTEPADAIGVELSLPLEGNIKIGGEFIFHFWDVSHDQGSPVERDSYGSANVYLLMLQARYTFNQAGRVRPYLGIGAGFARFSLHSDTSVILEGYTEQINGAIDFMLTDIFGLSLGIMRNYIDVDDRYGNHIDTGATVYQLSVNLHFN